MRIVRRLAAFVFFLLSVAVLLGGLEVYLAATGRSAYLMRALVDRLGRLVEGQRTDQMDLSVRVRPAARELEGTARLVVHGEAGRRRMYFLLNPGLSVREVWEDRADGTRVPLPAYRVWLATVVELPAPLGQDQSMRLGIRYGGKLEPSRLNSAGAVLEDDAVAVTANDLWYPADLQGFVQADVEVTLPAALQLVHNGRELERVVAGTSQRVRWSAERPVVGLALVAGRYRDVEAEREGLRYRVLLAEGLDLDGERILGALADSNVFLQSLYGASGFARLSVFVEPRLERAFHDGSGLIGIPPEAFRDGKYGFTTVAHEAAHSWWGATVAEQWLRPGTGGEWIVEGFAELSSWLAVESRFGEDALLDELEEGAFDPTRAGVLGDLSAIDNAIDPSVREIIYNKGGYVALQLRERVGAETFAAAAREFLERFRQQPASDRDLQGVFEEVSKQDLAGFFADWVRGDTRLDLALDPEDGGAAVRNHGRASAPAAIDFWRFPPAAEPDRQTIAFGATTPIGNVERLILDPRARTADMVRSNNVLPRRDNPRHVARSARGELMVVYGEPYSWMPASVVVLDLRGGRRQTWHFDGGLLGNPVWSADGTRILAGERLTDGRRSLVELNVTDGSRGRLGEYGPASACEAGTFVARGDRLDFLSAAGDRTVVRHPEGRVSAPLASPDGSLVAYALAAGDGMDLRAVRPDGEGDRLLLSWSSPGVRWRWAPDGSRLFAALSGDWDWQLWEIPISGDGARVLVHEAAAIGSVDVEPTGGRLAMVAQPSLDEGSGRKEVFVLEPGSGKVERFNLGGSNAIRLAWIDSEGLAVIAADPAFSTLPRHRELRRLRLADGSLVDFP